MKKIIFIDRDGVINVDPIGDYVKSWREFKFENTAIEGLRLIYGLGYEIMIISNQAGVGDGIFSEIALWDVHNKMIDELTKNGVEILSTYYCLHGKQAGCACRKPQLGLFQKAVRGIEYDPQKTFFIGDKATDMEAGKKFGLMTIFVRTGHGKGDEKMLNKNFLPDYRAENLLTVAELLKTLQ